MTKGKIASNRRWNEANLDRLYITIEKGGKESIKAHADAHSESVNGFVNRAIREAMERDNKKVERDS